MQNQGQGPGQGPGGHSISDTTLTNRVTYGMPASVGALGAQPQRSLTSMTNSGNIDDYKWRDDDED